VIWWQRRTKSRTDAESAAGGKLGEQGTPARFGWAKRRPGDVDDVDVEWSLRL
jgi:hypothetical protein